MKKTILRWEDDILLGIFTRVADKSNKSRSISMTPLELFVVVNTPGIGPLFIKRIGIASIEYLAFKNFVNYFDFY